jgi:hypothetical protein
MSKVRKFVGYALEAWGGLRLVIDLLGSFEATRAYAGSAYAVILSAPGSITVTVTIIVVGAALLLYEPIKTLVGKKVEGAGEESEDNRKVAPILGSANLLIRRLGMHDLKTVTSEFLYTINLGVFVRATVAVTDMPRTIPNFVLELQVGDVKYSATANRKIGDYYHRYTRQEADGWSENSVDEEMGSLLKKLEMPLLPGTHAEDWLMFEFDGVAGPHEQSPEATFHLYALDVSGRRYKLDTSKMVVEPIGSDEYARAKQQ